MTQPNPQGPVRVVPEVLTRQMRDAYYEAHARSEAVLANADEAWSAILAAAPNHIGEPDEMVPAPSPAAPKEVERLERVAQIIWGQFAPSCDVDPENALGGEYMIAARAILAALADGGR